MNIKNVKQNLEYKGYTVSCFLNKEEAANYIDSDINNKTVGFGDSYTISSMNLYKKLSSHNKVFDPQNCNNSDFISVAKDCLTTDIFITSVNAMTESGELVNIDGTGNRIAGSLFGHQKVYFILGINKITPNLDEAIHRVRNVAAPQNAHRLKLKTPCAKEGNCCYNCSSKERICNGMMIYFRKMNNIEMEVVLIDEELGY